MRLLKWTGIGLAFLAGLAIAAYAALYILSERVLQRTWDVPRPALSIPSDTAALVQGQRLATIRGCFGGCHGNQAEGAVMFDKPMIARIVAPDLTTAVRKYNDADLAAAIRNGVRPDGRSMIAMPSEAFVALSDDDLAKIIGFLRSLPPSNGKGPDASPGPLGRIGLVSGKFKPVAQHVAEIVAPPAAATPESEPGRYLARTTCAQCHGTDLRGASNPSFTAPDLRTVKAYSPEAFTQLMRTGAAIGGRTVGVMSAWSRDHLSKLNDAEIGALYGYLHAMP